MSKQATRIVNLFKDKDIKQVNAMVGLEQEYFLIDKELYKTKKRSCTYRKNFVWFDASKKHGYSRTLFWQYT